MKKTSFSPLAGEKEATWKEETSLEDYLWLGNLTFLEPL